MWKILLLVLSAGLALAQNPNTAEYPATAADINDLFIASNRAQTTLTGAITSGATAIPVTSTTLFTISTIIVIDNEAIAVCAKNATEFTICASGRGKDGTTAAAHSNGAIVYGSITAWYHNQVVAEIIALETYAVNGNTTRTANTALAGPTTGAAAAPTFRALVAADLPLVPLATGVSGTLSLANGGGLTTATDDTVRVGNGTALQEKTLPNCTDTGGQHVNYTQSSNAFSCGTSGATSLGFATVTYAATQVVDLTTCEVCQITLTGNITSFSFSNASTTRPEFAVVFVQDGTGTRTLSGVNAAIIGMCEIVLTAGKRTAVKFYYDGTNSYTRSCSSPDSATNIINVNGFDYTLPGVDATLQSAAQDQAAQDRSCISSTGSDTFTCGLTPALGAYTNAMQLMFRPTGAACSGAASINIDSLGAKNFYAADGTSNPECAQNRDYWLTYDTALNGAVGGWKMPAAAAGSGVTIDGAYLSSGGTCYMPSLDLMAATTPSASGYTQINSGVTATITDVGGGTCTHRRYNVAGTGSGAPINSGEFISIGANTTHVVAFSCNALSFRGITDASKADLNNINCYVGFRESATQKRMAVLITSRADTYGIGLVNFTDDDLWAANPTVVAWAGSGGTKLVVRLRVDGTRIFVDYSENGGSTWREIYRSLYTTDFTTAPDQFGEWAQPGDISSITTDMFIYSRSTN